jgi:O-antigen ligase
MTRSLISNLIRYNTFNYVLLLAIILGLNLLERLKDTQTRALQAFCGFLILGMLTTPDMDSAISQVLNIASIFGMLAYFLRARSDPRILYHAALVNGMLAGVGSLVFFLQIDRLPWLAPDAQDRFINANAFAYFPLAGLFTICLAYPSVLPKEQGKLGVLALMTLFGLFLSGSRSAIILGVVCLLYLLITTSGLSKQLLLVASIPIIAVTSVALFPSLQTYAVNRFMRMFDSQYSLTSRTSGRSDVAAVGWSIFLKHPLGVGTGAFSLAYEQADADEMAFAGIRKQAHSGWVKALVENGIVGAICMAWYVLSFYSTGRRTGKRNLVRLGLFVTTVLSVAFLGTEFQSKALWFLSCGAAIRLNYGTAGENFAPAANRRSLR